MASPAVPVVNGSTCSYWFNVRWCRSGTAVAARGAVEKALNDLTQASDLQSAEGQDNPDPTPMGIPVSGGLWPCRVIKFGQLEPDPHSRMQSFDPVSALLAELSRQCRRRLAVVISVRACPKQRIQLAALCQTAKC